jgi:hypothetical protein
MAHIKDMDEHEPGSERRDAPTPDDLMLVDLLYGELDENARARAEQRVREDQALGSELDAFSNLRALMRELPEAEPPESLSAKLLHAAAAEVSGSRAAAQDEEPKSLWSRLKSLFLPIGMHPAFAAAASVTLVAGIAGALYVSGNLKAAAPRLESAEQAQFDVAAGAPPPMEAPEGAVANTTLAPAPVQAADPAATAPAASRDESDGVARGALARRPADTAAATPVPEPEATGALADDYGAEEQSPRQFAQAPAEAVEAPAGNSLGGRGGYLDTDKNAPQLAQRTTTRKPQEKGEYRRDEGGKKLDLSESLEDELAKSVTTGDVGSTRSSAAPGNGPVATQGSSGGVAGGGGAAAPQKQAPAAKPKAPATAATPPPPPQAAPPAADREQEEAASEAAAPDSKAPARKEAKARERSDSSATRVSEMHKKALAAAARGDCATVRATGNAIRQLDPTYHRDSFARDARLQECLSAAVKKK